MKTVSNSLKFSKSISKPKNHSGVVAPVYTVLDDNVSDDYHEQREFEDWNDWTPNSWGY